MEEARSHTDSAPALEVTILYGSQTGNSAWLADQYTARLRQAGYRVTCSCMSKFPHGDLARVESLLVLISTFRNGDPPDTAVPFCRFLLGDEAPRLPRTRFSVLALGDTTYEEFCTIGRDLDRRLEQLGGRRLFPRVECDIDFEETADAWFDGVMEALGDSGTPVSSESPDAAADDRGGRGDADPSGRTHATADARLPAASSQPGLQPANSNTSATAEATAAPSSGKAAREPSKHSRRHPFLAAVLANRNLNGPGSDRETRHLIFSLQGSGFEFEPGDSLGIYPSNHPHLVDDLIHELGYDGQQPVVVGDEHCTVREALSRRCEITVLTRPLIEKLAEWSRSLPPEMLPTHTGNGATISLEGLDLLDLVQRAALRGVPPQEFVSALRRMSPRLYSIANSPKMYPDEAHVTISVVRYRAAQRERYGVCSVECAERIDPGDTLPVYVNPNPYFRLPPDPRTPVIMVGPGTGCAPFRAFMQHREQTAAAGENWLFFGARHRAADFLYEDEWQRWHGNGLLTRLDVAFSRDTARKVYVQHRMTERGKEIFAWLQRGAHVYVAGDEQNMAPHVHETLLQIVQQYGGGDRRRAEQYVSDLQRERRYQRDLY